MRSNVSLHEGWQVGWSAFSGSDASPERVHGLELRDAVVPGDVHLDMVRHGLAPDPFVADNADRVLWIESKDWWYTLHFRTPTPTAGQRMFLLFHGLDTFATVWLNGHELGQTANMFIRHEFDVTDVLRDDPENELVVRLAAPSHSIAVDPAHQPLIWSPERLFCRKAQMSFGWDIAPRLVTTGIWRPVELVTCDAARITDVWTRVLQADSSGVEVAVSVDVEWMTPEGGNVELSGTLHNMTWGAGGLCAAGLNTFETRVSLRDAPPWWPIGYGPPERVACSAVLAVAGEQVDRRDPEVGLAKTELVQEPQAEGAASFRFRCNGRDVFVTGLNWTPMDAVFARVTPEMLTERLEALAELGCNMLRIWGGGVYEQPHFYRECDRLGIMVWQDFMMSCGWYPQTDAFATALEAEARQVVRDLRNHACIALWCGDNEVDMFYESMAAGNRLTRDVLAGVCAELDPDTPYIASSPCSPSGARTSETSGGDSHCWGHGRAYSDGFFMDLRCRFLSEFGHLSLPSMDVVRRYFPEGTEWPLTNPMWRYHAADTIRNPAFRGAKQILEALEACGRPLPVDIGEAVSASQNLHADAVCAWIERYCEDPDFGGFLLWNVGDCWPQQSDAIFDYLGIAKPVVARLGPLFRKVREARSS